MRTKRQLRGTTSIQSFDCTLWLTSISLVYNGTSRAILLAHKDHVAFFGNLAFRRLQRSFSVKAFSLGLDTFVLDHQPSFLPER